MDNEVASVKCRGSFYFFFLNDTFKLLLKQNDGYKITEKDGEEYFVDLEIQTKKVRIQFKKRWKADDDIDVIVCDYWMCCSQSFQKQIRKWTMRNKMNYPCAPIIVVCSESEKKYDLTNFKEATREDKIMNRKVGDKLANEIGAVKYIECSYASCRGIKILIDEIAWAGLGRIEEKKATETRVICEIL